MGADAPMIKNGRSKATFGACYDGCSCHNDRATRRRAKRPAKRADTRRWRSNTEQDQLR